MKHDETTKLRPHLEKEGNPTGKIRQVPFRLKIWVFWFPFFASWWQPPERERYGAVMQRFFTCFFTAFQATRVATDIHMAAKLATSTSPKGLDPGTSWRCNKIWKWVMHSNDSNGYFNVEYNDQPSKFGSYLQTNPYGLLQVALFDLWVAFDCHRYLGQTTLAKRV